MRSYVYLVVSKSLNDLMFTSVHVSYVKIKLIVLYCKEIP